MADAKYLKEDDYLNVSEDTCNIIYHPNLNVILLFTKCGDVKVLDVNSGLILHSCSLLVDNQLPKAKFLPEQEKILFWNNSILGLRGDYNGVLLLDTVLQTPVSQADDMIRLELLLSEAMLFLQSIQSLEQQGLENTADVTNELILKIEEARQNNKKGIKAQRWETICLELPHSSLKMVASSVALTLKRLGRQVPSLAIASAINERLTDLIVGGRVMDSENVQRFHMYSEAARRQTFEQWPHMDYKWALPDQMAQAGFYHQPGESGGDRAMCFTCNVCLVCWEKTDEPWSEHERHSPDCAFVKGEYTQNVPLTVTYATNPAVATSRFTIISNGCQSNIICTGNRIAEVNVWNIERQTQKVHQFTIDTQAIQTKFNLINCKHDIELTALATYCGSSSGKNPNSGPNSQMGATKKPVSMSSKAKMLASKIVAGVSVVRQVNNNDTAMDQEMEGEIEKKLLLIIYQLKENLDKIQNTNAKQDSTSTSVTTNKKSSSSTLSTIEERFEDDEFMKFLASETDLQQLQLLEDYIDNIDNTSSSDKIAEIAYKNLFAGNSNGSNGQGSTSDESKNDDQKISKLKAFNHMSNSSKWAWSQTDAMQTATPTNNSQEMEIATNNVNSNKNASERLPHSMAGQITSGPVQFVTVVPFLSDDYEIDEIIPSPDTRFLLVVLRRCTQLEGTSLADDEMETDIPKENSNVQLILYSIEDNGLLDEVPVCVRILEEKNSPLEFCMLPKYEGKRRVFEGPDTENGIFAMTCADGSLKIISLSSLKTISEAKVDTGNFVSVTYCKSLERICACTDKGSLHFYSFYEFDEDSSDERDDDQCFSNIIGDPHSQMGRCNKSSNIIYDAMPSTSSQVPTSGSGSGGSNTANKQETELIAYKNNLTLNDLKILYSLTLFEELPLPYNAEVPGCWSELIQAQKQRRHPNHLRPGDDSNLTRTWRLHNDATTWDEHLIELNVPKSVTQTIGHIDFKFSLYQPCTNPPAIQVTLLKQKSLGICSRRKIGTKSGGDDTSEMNSSGSDSKESCDNPVLSEEFLQARCAEILVGPIELSSCMDLSEQGGVVTLTSPKLLKTKGRNFLLHIKTVADMSKDGQGKTRVPVKKKGLTSILLTSFQNSSSAQTASSSQPVNFIGKDRISFYSSKPRTNNFYTGCDWLHEISITVRAAKHIHKVPNERLQRLVMLESNQLLDNLLTIVSRDNKSLMQNLAFDILNWITVIRITRYRSPVPTMCKWSAKNFAKNANSAALDPNEQQNECAMIIGDNLQELVKNCMVLNDRSVAHKCSKLILASLDGAQNLLHSDICQAFEERLKMAIVNALPYIINCEHAGALRWFTLLISGTSSLDVENKISEQSIKLLIDVAREMVQRYNPHGLLLRSRFGLYGLPFESELFDAELPNLSKTSNLIYTYVPATKPGIQVGNQPMDLKSFCVSDGSELRVLPFQLRRKGIGSHFKGALEVEPLHFVCTGTSEATRLENTDSAVVQSGHIIDDIMLETPINSLENAVSMANAGGSKKETGDKENLDDDMMNNVKNVLVDKIFYSTLKKHIMKHDMKKVAKSFDLEVSVLSGYNEPAETNDEWGPPEPRVVFLTNNSANNENSDAILEDTTATSASLNNKIQEFFEESNANEDTAFQWHKILSTPPKQTIVVDRMHSGARRYVILDFGQPTMLTDLIIPAYPDLAPYIN